MYRIVCFTLMAISVQALDFGAFKSSGINALTKGGITALTTYGQGGSLSSALKSGLNTSVSNVINPEATLPETATSTKERLLKVYQKNGVALSSLNPQWKKDVEIVYAALNNFSKNPVKDAATQTKIRANVTKANNIIKLASLLVKMNGTLKPNDGMWNTVMRAGKVIKTSDLVDFDNLTSTLESLNKIGDEFKEVMDSQSFSSSAMASVDTLTKYAETPTLDEATNKQIQKSVAVARNQAAAIPILFASLASTNPLSPGDDQWSFLEPEDKSKKYDFDGNEAAGSLSLDTLTSLPSKGPKDVLQENKDKVKVLAIKKAFAQTKAKQEPILSQAIKSALTSLQGAIGSLDSDASAKLETINFSPKLYLNLLEIFSKDLHLTSLLQVEYLGKLAKIGKTIATALPHIVQSQWTILPGDALWTSFVDEQGKSYSITELAAVAALAKVAPQNLVKSTEGITENMPSLDDVNAALSALNAAYQQYETQLKANIEQQWISNIEEIGTKLDTLSKASTPDNSAAFVVITANNMVQAFPMLASEPGGAPGDEQWSTLIKDGKHYSLDGQELS